jgi:hypothetical protein
MEGVPRRGGDDKVVIGLGDWAGVEELQDVANPEGRAWFAGY